MEIILQGISGPYPLGRNGKRKKKGQRLAAPLSLCPYDAMGRLVKAFDQIWLGVVSAVV
jgi:hypothetical protein